MIKLQESPGLFGSVSIDWYNSQSHILALWAVL
jgi:hypothetical protein